MDKVFVLGTGTMGSGIVLAIAKSEIPVYMYGRTDDSLERGRALINRRVNRLFSNGKILEKDKNNIESNIIPTKDLNDALQCNIVIESIAENFELKYDLFAKLSNICDENTIFATNTSSLSITALGGSVSNSENFCAFHFFVPADTNPALEIAKGMKTSDETCKKLKEFAVKIEKSPIIVKDYPGFVFNRLVMPLINEACFMLENQVATPEEIDRIMKLSGALTIGPLHLADLVGLDVVLSIMLTLYNEFKDDKYRPCILLRKMVDSNLLGRKNGRGFFSYNED